MKKLFILISFLLCFSILADQDQFLIGQEKELRNRATQKDKDDAVISFLQNCFSAYKTGGKIHIDSLLHTSPDFESGIANMAEHDIHKKKLNRRKRRKQREGISYFILCSLC